MKLEPQTEPHVPEYLSRHFWWAYMWPKSAPFFDHPAVISSILFGQYRLLMKATLNRVAGLSDQGRMLQLTCVYGNLTPSLMQEVNPEPLHVTDIVPLQLDLARGKAPEDQSLLPTRMNAEKLGYRSNSFGSTLIFFLLHELPPAARRNVLSESLRTLQSGGTLLITEYAEKPPRHWFSRFALFRKILLRAEPFLGPFWEENLLDLLRELAAPLGKRIEEIHIEHHFKGFYRVVEYRVTDVSESADNA